MKLTDIKRKIKTMTQENPKYPICGSNAAAWAAEFDQHKADNGWGINDIDEGLMVGWFANAIEQTKQHETNPGYFDGRPFNADMAISKALEAIEGGVFDDIDLIIAMRMWREGSWAEFLDFIAEDK